jgi:putative ABC transport system substrate-binding protein
MTSRTLGFMITLALGLLVTALIAEAQPPTNVHRIGWLSVGSPLPEFHPYWEAFRQRLRELGYVEGRNLLIDYRYAEGNQERRRALAAELVRLRVNLIVAFGPHASAASKQATAAIPIVMVAAMDPIGTGLAASLAQPGGNVTGMALDLPEIAGKLLQLLLEAIPHARRVAVLWNPTAPGISTYALESVAAQALGLTIPSSLLFQATEVIR